MSLADDKQLGVEFEAELTKVFKALQAAHKFTYHRFVDTKAARNLVAAQPSDFLIASAKGVFLVEAKASLVQESLVQAKGCIRPSQIGSILKWHRAGHKSFVIFYCQITGQVEFWDGETVANERWESQPILIGYYLDLQQIIKELVL